FQLQRGAPVAPVFAVLVGASLGVREVLRVQNRRQAFDRLASSLDLEGRLLAMQGTAGQSLRPEETLGRSCSLAAEVLKASATLAWMAEGDGLVLRAVGGTSAPEGLEGRRLSLSDPKSLASRVFHARAWELSDAGLNADKVDRFLATILDAGPILGVPILGDEGTLGVLVLVRPRGEPAFVHWDQQKAMLIAAQVSTT